MSSAFQVIRQAFRFRDRAVFNDSEKNALQIIKRAFKLAFRDGDVIPTVPLAEKHIKNCTLVLNRQTLLSRMKKRGKVAEIGVNRGDFSELILKIAEPEQLHLIDIWNSVMYPESLLKEVSARFRKPIDNGKVQIHRESSAQAVDYFENNYFDWIYLDANHSYDSVSEELIKYAPKIKHDGIITGHDYTQGHWEELCRYGVVEAVHEFCVKHEWELVYLTVEPAEVQSFAIKRIQRVDKVIESVQT